MINQFLSRDEDGILRGGESRNSSTCYILKKCHIYDPFFLISMTHLWETSRRWWYCYSSGLTPSVNHLPAGVRPYREKRATLYSQSSNDCSATSRLTLKREATRYSLAIHLARKPNTNCRPVLVLQLKWCPGLPSRYYVLIPVISFNVYLTADQWC